MLDVQGKHVLVAGLGKSGMAAAEVLADAGAVVSVLDSKAESAVDFQLPDRIRAAGGRTWFSGALPDPETRWDLLVLSPGISLEQEFVRQAQNRGVEVIGELELAFRAGDARYIAITGTNGKTTTTTLVGELLRLAGRETHVAGNIGKPAVTAAVQAGADAWMVTEVSSFQLETTVRFHPVVSAILNITPDHMDRHKTMENYAAVKARIFAAQTPADFLIVNREDPLAWKTAAAAGAAIVPFSRSRELPLGAFVRDGFLVLRTAEENTVRFCRADELQIPGAHNLENALAAAAVAWFAGVSASAITRGLQSFRGVAHRLEYVDTVNGVRYVNDSKGTNPDASVRAIEAVQGGIYLIAGGYDKNADFTDWIRTFDGRVRRLLLLGATAEKIKTAAEEERFTAVTVCGDMKSCVEKAASLAGPGDTVLLSPACASWDMYNCFEERGDHFRSCVKELSHR